jgi:hypothetical protein
MFADILQDEYGRDLEDITRRTKNSWRTIKTAMDIITDLEKFANKKN